MTIKDVMSKDVRTVRVDTPISDAAHIMRWEGVGALPVLGETKRPVGIVTDRDIALGVCANGIPCEANVRTIMTRDVHTISEDSDPKDALTIMEQWRVGRLAVCNASGELVGIVTLDDLAVATGGEGPLIAARQAMLQRTRDTRASRFNVAFR